MPDWASPVGVSPSVAFRDKSPFSCRETSGFATIPGDTSVAKRRVSRQPQLDFLHRHAVPSCQLILVHAPMGPARHPAMSDPTAAPNDCDRLYTVVEGLSRQQGFSAATIAAAVGENFTPRTVQRRLHELVAAGKLHTTGSGRSLRFQLEAPPSGASPALARHPPQPSQARSAATPSTLNPQLPTTSPQPSTPSASPTTAPALPTLNSQTSTFSTPAPAPVQLSTLNSPPSTSSPPPSTSPTPAPSAAAEPSTLNPQLSTFSTPAPDPNLVERGGIWYYQYPGPGGGKLKFEHGAWTPVDRIPPPAPTTPTGTSPGHIHLSSPLAEATQVALEQAARYADPALSPVLRAMKKLLGDP